MGSSQRIVQRTMWKPILCGVLLFSGACATALAPYGDAPSVEVVDDGFAPLFASASLEGWDVLGDAHFELACEPDGRLVLRGSAENMQRNSFLVSKAEYGDFELLVDVRIAEGNSGVQVRSRADWTANDGAGRLWGYQIEVDPSDRAWSGGLYDEGRRGWLDSLEGRETARAALVVGEWNQYRILCEGARIRTWVNGVACADFVDAGDNLDLTGHLAFQVHNGPSASVAFRNPRIRIVDAVSVFWS